MLGRFDIDQERRLVRFEFDEAATIDDWNQAQALLAKISGESGIRRVLVNVRKQKFSAPMGTLFQFAANLPATVAIAVLSEAHRDDHKFAETVALNRGKNVGLFFGPEDEAIRWLMKWPD